MQSNKVEIIESFRTQVSNSNKESIKKEHFYTLLNRLYAEHPSVIAIIDKMNAGSEKAIFDIPRENKMYRGSADTLYNHIIIEFENILSKTLNHAKKQLAGYYLGNRKSGEGDTYTMIVSDFIHWKVFKVDDEQKGHLDNLNEEELNLVEIKDAAFSLNSENSSEFYFWIDRFLFKEEKLKATLKRVQDSFGSNSPVFDECFNIILNVFQDAKKYGDVQVSFEQWNKFLSIAYGSFNGTDELFVIHSYLSIVAKIMAFEVLSNNEYIDDNKLKSILDGEIFNNYNITNFVENDFFHWVHNERYFKHIVKALRLISQEASNFEFEKIDEDILKGVYQELIDLDTRHSLGEYYTPDWLCERIVNEFDFKVNEKILDPSCGSGSFLRAAIHRLQFLHKDIKVDEIINSIYGIDIHPLSVQIAKTTILISLGNELLQLNKKVSLNIILANTLLTPDGIEDLFGKNFKMEIDREKLTLNSQIFENVKLFDSAITVCDDLANSTLGEKSIDIELLETNIRSYYTNGGLTQSLVSNFHKIYLSLKKTKEAGRDSIWKFIIQNLYKPYFLKRSFDYVIGNPPWFTYSSIKNEEYQNILNKLANKFEVKPSKAANMPHLEIAAIFLAYCNNYFLKPNGKTVFVLPRSFFNSDHHENTRSGDVIGLKITSIWDLENVSPLFKIPTCVMFAEPGDVRNKKIPQTGLEGLLISGRVPTHNSSWEKAKDKLKEENVKWYLINQGKSNALSNQKLKQETKVNPYRKDFKQGATIVPRTLFFVEIPEVRLKGKPVEFAKYERDWWKDRQINLQTANSIKPDAKKPWRDINMNGYIHSQYLFRTALSKNILPFCLYKPEMVVLPVAIKQKPNGDKYIEMQDDYQILSSGYLHVSNWFKAAANYWKLLSTEKSKKMTLLDRVNYQKGITSQNLNIRYVVIYTASAKDANAVVVDRESLDLEFLAESACYLKLCKNKLEANYLVAILNSKKPNLKMKSFQAKGLWGPRHVHKKILDVYFPKFDAKNELHLKLAELAENANEKAKTYMDSNPPDYELSALKLGKLRVDLKNHISQEMDLIDEIVEKLIS